MGLRFQRSFKRLDILDILEWCLGPGMAGISSTLIKYVPFKPTVDVFFNAHIQILKKKEHENSCICPYLFRRMGLKPPMRTLG